ncbi:Mbov_0395 family pilin-like conjugal transfer protein [Spiroplasma platyhelix]|uniref:Transmembrane protein n=1 Tax=Spiroplasma platyhelix PALS-1 TaxID=1276218 RepID=A0A846UAA4_9MOLU|nr:hypothetical protein [Spiroplasma platyhelix]MBE4704423.1 hypothetical protein [Spiroplasma platyhelix PALS-1]NKE38793.1 hypothetical protein [Spiroplasma platyhelix PALS-1]UJB29005.1 hypothetical protein SPLAT_v1c02410 [Spiroplasma platyhelix PALS-1]
MTQFALSVITILADVPDFSAVTKEVTIWVNAALAVLIALEIIFAALKAIWIWWSVIRNSDEPDSRAVYLNALKWPVIAIVGTLAVVGIANVVIKMVETPSLGGS